MHAGFGKRPAETGRPRSELRCGPTSPTRPGDGHDACQRAEGPLRVEPILRVLNIAASTYYGWLARDAAPGPREVEDRGLLSEIVDIHDRSGQTYGSPRVHATLARRGIRVGRKRVERLMREHDLHGAFLRKGWRGGSTKQNPKADPAPDLVNRNFTTDAPNRLWVADATRIVTGDGVLWLAAVRDAFSNRIVGWKTSDRCNTDLVLGALEYGIWSRDVRDGQLIHHSDRGSTYTAIKFSERLADNGILPSMGSVGDSYDNALSSFHRDQGRLSRQAGAACRLSG
ncbi:IS3 family transposase [Micromonospora chalcea]|uniref:IS3 family transposase n=1 Tax=Micromonospora sp. TSRI0369 TaxID=1703936 RepID=UPI0011613431|nr:IS3 family transposase [Micromonospora sp. TSRI0369]